MSEPYHHSNLALGEYEGYEDPRFPGLQRPWWENPLRLRLQKEAEEIERSCPWLQEKENE